MAECDNTPQQHNVLGGVEHDGFESEQAARKDAQTAITVVLRNVRKCDGDCEGKNRKCVLTFDVDSMNAIIKVKTYKDADGDLAYKYKIETGKVTSTCECVNWEKKKKKPGKK
jgi:hypothetical protein